VIPQYAYAMYPWPNVVCQITMSQNSSQKSFGSSKVPRILQIYVKNATFPCRSSHRRNVIKFRMSVTQTGELCGFRSSGLRCCEDWHVDSVSAVWLGAVCPSKTSAPPSARRSYDLGDQHPRLHHCENLKQGNCSCVVVKALVIRNDLW
jgi:hypothetical protein